MKTDKKIEEILDLFIAKVRTMHFKSDDHEHLSYVHGEKELTEELIKVLNTEVQKAVEDGVKGYAQGLMKASNGEPFMKIRNDAKYGDHTDGVRVSMLDNIVENLYFKLTEKGVETYLQTLKDKK